MALPGLLAGLFAWRSAMQTREPNAWVGANLGGAALVRLADTVPDGAHLYAPFTPSAVVLWVRGPAREAYRRDHDRSAFRRRAPAPAGT